MMLWFSSAILLIATIPPAGSNQIYSADLSKCLVAKTTETDKVGLVRWIFASISASPQVADMASITAEERSQFQRRTGELFARLIGRDCRSEAVAALRYEGPLTFETAFGMLGQVAMRDLMGDAAVAASMADMAKFADTPEIKAVLREAGIFQPPDSPGE
ncbi:hypothetical protein [Sphingomonas sp.]